MTGQQEQTVAYTPSNLPLGIGAGVIAALLGAALWMLVTVVSGLQIGYVALAIGAMVGYAIRLAGKGSTTPFGIAGAVLTLVGCVLGQLLAVVQLAANSAGVGFFQVLTTVDTGTLISSIFTSTGPITYLIYGIGIYEGYKFSMNR